MEVSSGENGHPNRSGGLLEASTERVLDREFGDLPEDDLFKQAFDLTSILETPESVNERTQRTAIANALQDGNWLRRNMVVDQVVTNAVQDQPPENLEADVCQRVLEEALAILRQRQHSIATFPALLDTARLEVNKQQNWLSALETQQKNAHLTLETRIKGVRLRLAHAQEDLHNRESMVEANSISVHHLERFLFHCIDDPEIFSQSIRRAIHDASDRVNATLAYVQEQQFNTGEIQAIIEHAPIDDGDQTVKVAKIAARAIINSK